MKKNIIITAAVLIVLQAVPAGAQLPGSDWVKHEIGQQSSPIYLCVKDMDGDGDFDVAATTNQHPNVFTSEVAWFENKRLKGTWEKHVISSDESEVDSIKNANGIDIADIDNDGRQDVIVGTGQVTVAMGSVYWFKAPVKKSGSWQRFTLKQDVACSYFKMYALDVDNDTNIDIVAGGEQEGASVFSNPGNTADEGATWPQLILPADTYKTGSSLYLDDVDGDGSIDILNTYLGDAKNEGEDDPGNVSWYGILQGDGGEVSFERHMIDPALLRAFDVNALDVNGDGRKDVLVSTFQEKKIYWLEAPASQGGLWTRHLITDDFDGTDLYTGDIDGDGQTDFLIAGLFNSRLSWFSHDGAGETWTEHLIDTTDLPGDVSLNDMDGDGDLDVVLASMGTDKILWYENRLNPPSRCILKYLWGNNAPQLAYARAFRDKVLAAIPGGRKIIEAYYRWSPAMIRGLQAMQQLTRADALPLRHNS